MSLTIAYSSERQGSLQTQLGTAHYSYRFVEDALVRLLQSAGISTVYIAEPQIYKTVRAYEELLREKPQNVVHIAFRSTENLRLMVGARNICHFAWEFEVMQDNGLITDSILDNQVHMLNLMDEVWVGCNFSRAVLQKYGCRNTYVVPAPIIDSDLPVRLRFADCLDYVGSIPTIPMVLAGDATREANERIMMPLLGPLSDNFVIRNRANGTSPRIFVTVLNPGDLRKNLLNLIEGFVIAANSLRANDILIIKLIVPNRGDFRHSVLYDHVRPRCNGAISYCDSRVIFISDYLSDPQMNALFCLADYYLCATHCEGFNRPLLQAMSFGTVPVTTSNTAMLDYINEYNSVIISETRLRSPIPGMAGDIARVPYSIDFASRFDVARACCRAITQSAENFNRMSAEAQRTVLEKYGADKILRLARDRLGVRAPAEVYT
jgi:glycosyltransferase involved in cell wall biosynthesis